VNVLKRNWLFFASIALFLALAAYRLGEATIWYDEAYSFALSDFDALELIRRTGLDVHPPFYYLLLKAWRILFGDSLLAIRSLSVFAGIGALIALQRLLLQRFSFKTANLAVAVTAISPIFIRYAQEARMYMLVAFLMTLATLAFVKIIDGSRHQRRWQFIYALSLVLAVYSHYYALFIVLAHVLFVAWKFKPYTLKRLRNVWLEARDVIVVWVVAAALFLPWLPTAWQQFNEIQGGFWIGPVTHNSLLSIFSRFVLYREAWQLQSWETVGFLTVLAAIVVSLRAIAARNKSQAQRDLVVLLSLLVVVPVASTFLLSLPPFSPIFNVRYVMPVAGFFFALIAIGFVSLRENNKGLSLIVSAVLVGGLIAGLTNLYRYRDVNYDNLNENGISYVVAQTRSSQEPAVHIAHSSLLFYDLYFHLNDQESIKWYAPEGLSQYGGSSLVYDSNKFALRDYNEVTDDYVWVYFDDGDEPEQFEIPRDWSEVTTVEANAANARLYMINK